jgi:hypothetical protein
MLQYEASATRIPKPKTLHKNLRPGLFMCAGGMAQAVECRLPSKHEALSSNTSETEKKKKKKNKN